MSKKKVKITHKGKTFAFISVSKTGNGAEIGFPQEIPLKHITFIAEKISEQLKFSFHETNEEKDCICKYDKSRRVEISFKEQELFIIGQHIETLMLNHLEKYYSFHQVPGSAHIGGIFTPGFNFLKSDNNVNKKTSIPLESFKPFIVKKSRHLKYYQEKIWLVLKKRKGRKGLFYDIGILFGSDCNDFYYYFSYNNLMGVLKFIFDNYYNFNLPVGDMFANKDNDKGILIKGIHI